MQQVQSNEFQNVALRREADRAEPATKPSAPVELSLELLAQIGGGLTPNDTWATTPNDTW
jgi:hypothetical protein